MRAEPQRQPRQESCAAEVQAVLRQTDGTDVTTAVEHDEGLALLQDEMAIVGQRRRRADVERIGVASDRIDD